MPQRKPACSVDVQRGEPCCTLRSFERVPVTAVRLAKSHTSYRMARKSINKQRNALRVQRPCSSWSRSSVLHWRQPTSQFSLNTIFQLLSPKQMPLLRTPRYPIGACDIVFPWKSLGEGKRPSGLPSSSKKPQTHKKFLEWEVKYGKTFGIYEGGTKVIVTSDVSIVQDVLTDQFDSFYSRKVR